MNCYDPATGQIGRPAPPSPEELTPEFWGLRGRAADLFRKIINNVQINPERGCWTWLKGHSGNGRGGGYGRVSVDNRMMAVHRVMWQLINGPTHRKRQIDHLCRNRLCCNPDHLEGVTHKQNQRRRDQATKSPE